MMTRTVLLSLSLSVAAHAAAPETGKEKLRRIIRMPTLNMQAGFGFDTANGFTLLTDTRDHSAEIKALRGELAKSPGDPALHFRLGTLLDASHAHDEAKIAFEKAVTLYRARVEAQPANGPLLTEFANALDEAGKDDEATSRFREAVRIAPKEWKCWLGLAKNAESRAFPEVLGSGAGNSGGRNNFRLLLSKERPSAQKVERVREALRESGDAFNRAAELGPQEPEVFLYRAMLTAWSNVMNQYLESPRDTDLELFKDLFTPLAFADMQKAARLAPDDYRMNAMAAMFEAYSFIARHTDSMGGDGGAWGQMPELSRRSLSATISRLDTISLSANPTEAAGACETLGMLRMLLHSDTDAALSLSRRAVALDPSREQAWDLATGLLAKPGSFEDLVAFAQQRLRHKDTTRTRIGIAKALFYLNREDQAAAQVKEALKRAPDDFIANLSHAALLLRKAKDRQAVLEAERFLKKAETLAEAFAKDSTDAIQTRFSMTDLILESSVCAALKDDLDSARALLKQVLAGDPDNDYAKAIQAALEK